MVQYQKKFRCRGQNSWLKYTDCAELKKITIRIYLNCLIYSYLFCKYFKFRCCSFRLIEKKLEITVQVSCLFYFLLSRFFKRKVKSGFFDGFYWALKKNNMGPGFLQQP